MALSFPNNSRSYDPTRGLIRFIGHDGMRQIPFSLEVEAVSKSTSAGEAAFLMAFDAARASIHAAARHAYRPDKNIAYVLTRADLR